MDARQCWNDRPQFGVHLVSQKLRAKNYKTFMGFNSCSVLLFLFYILSTSFPNLNAGNGRSSPFLTCPSSDLPQLLLQIMDQCIYLHRAEMHAPGGLFRPLFDLPLCGSRRATF
jgi:hypothetical protein